MKWSADDIIVLSRRAILCNRNWEQVSHGLSRRTPEECRAQWEKLWGKQLEQVQPSSSLQEHQNSILWKAEERNAIIQAVERERRASIEGPNQQEAWQRIALIVGTKDAAQCRRAWKISLDPKLKLGKFDEKELNTIAEGLKIYGDLRNRWKKIAGLLPGRNAQQIERHTRESYPTKVRPSWSNEDVEVLEKALQRREYIRSDNKVDWERLAREEFRGSVPAKALRELWSRRGPDAQSRKLGHWEAEEIERLDEALRRVDLKTVRGKWKSVADIVLTRTAAQCCQKVFYLKERAPVSKSE